MPAVAENIFAAYAQGYAGRAEAPVLHTPDGAVWSWADAERRSSQLANTLVAAGARPGDRISVQVDKSVEALWLYFACVRAGLVYHPLNPSYTPAEMDFFLRDAEPFGFVGEAAQVQALAGLLDAVGVCQRWAMEADGTGTLCDLSAPADTNAGISQSGWDTQAVLLYSSGTTGTPKGIVLTHGNLASNAQTLAQHWRFSNEDVLLHALPMFHVHGLFIALGCVFVAGASAIYLPRFDTDEVVRALPRATVMMGVPTYYTRLLQHRGFQSQHITRIRLFISGSAPLLPETFSAFEARTGQRILERYGMTETIVNTSNPVDGERRCGSVGLPLEDVEVRVVDEHLTPLPAGQVGSVQVRGPNVFPGYWRLPERTAEECSPDGFFNTGDLGTLDSDGYLRLSGRSRDLIISGGMNLYPKEIEEVLNAHPMVAESAVIGLPHPDFGEAAVAVVVSTGQGDGNLAERLREYVRLSLAAYKIPKRVILVESLPRNSMSKVQKNRLRDTWRELLLVPDKEE